jgi:glutamate racemase
VQDPAIDTLVLGCTHYPLLRHVIAVSACEIAGHEVAIVDSASAMADAAASALGVAGSALPVRPVRNAPGRLETYATDTSRLDELAARFLGEPVTSFELVDL